MTDELPDSLASAPESSLEQALAPANAAADTATAAIARFIIIAGKPPS